MISGAIRLSAFICIMATASTPAALAENPLMRMKNAAMSRVSAAQQKITAPVANSRKKTGAAIEIRDKWCVLIGVGQFQDTNVPPLKFAFKNVRALTDVFKNVGVGRFAPDHVIAIANRAATKDEIEKTLTDEWLCKKALPEDLVLIYICTRFARGDAGKGVVLLAHDTNLASAGEDGIPLSSLLLNVKRRLQSKRVIAFLDLSPAVSTSNPNAEGGLNIDRIAANSGVTILSATKGLQESQPSSAAPISCFTQYLIDAIGAGMGTLPLVAVAGHVVDGVNQDAASMYGKTQTPLFIAATDSPNITEVPLGVRLKSSMPEKTVHMGHPLDQLSIERPDIKAGEPGRKRRATTLIAANLPGNDLFIAQAAGDTASRAKQAAEPVKSAPAKAPAKPAQATPSKPLAKEASEDDDNDDTPPQNVDMGPYMKEMKKQIQSKWTPPKGMEAKRVVSVFSIRRNGNIEAPTIVESSGTEAVDESALAAIKAASPLPKLPPGSPQFIQIRYKFDWKVTPSSGSGK